MTTYYKVLTDKGAAYHGGVGRWPLPKGDEPGAWKRVEGDVIPCMNGLHVCARDQLIYWLGPAIFVCEVDDSMEVVDHGDKTVVRRARLVSRADKWNERTARLFAADCADKAIRDWQRASGLKCDPRSRAAIRAAREFANGNMSAAELSAARRSAARSAAESAAGSAAWSAARSWQTKRLFEYLDGKRGA